MKKFFTLAITMAFLSALMPTKVWGAERYAKAIVISEPTNGGFVYVSKSNSATPSYDKTNDVSENNKTILWGDYTFDFYRFYQENSGYVFKGWATSSTANSGDYDSQIGLTATSDNNVLWKPKTGTYYAIFARLAADQNRLSFTVNRPNTEEKTITISHSHAGNVTVTLSGNDANQFSLSGSTSFTSTSENTATVTVKYAPTCNGSHSATLTISNDNDLPPVKIELSGTAVLNEQSLSWDNEDYINVNMQKDAEQNISATASSGLSPTYSSDNTSVLTVDESGKLKAIKAGTATITASQAGDCTYAAATSITKTFTVNDKKTPSFWLENDPNPTQKNLMVDGTTSVNIANIDANGLTIDYDYDLLDYDYDATTGIATITAKNAGTATLTFTQTETTSVLPASRMFTFNISKSQGTLSVKSNLGSTYKVDDVIGDYSAFYTATNSEVPVVVQSSNNHVIAIENNQLKAVGAGTATITFSQEETYKWKPATAEKTITVEKYTLNASLTQASAVWGETISNPFTVTDDRENAFDLANCTVEAINPNIANYVNGQIVTFPYTGTAQFRVSYGGSAKYEALDETLSLTVTSATDNEACNIAEDGSQYTAYLNSKSQEYTFANNDEAGHLYVDIWEQSAATGTSYSIVGYTADGTQVSIDNSDNLSTNQTTKDYSLLNKGIRKIKITVSSATRRAYFQNVKVTRSTYYNASIDNDILTRSVNSEASANITVAYGLCNETTFHTHSTNPKFTISLPSFSAVANNTQALTVTTNSAINGMEETDITIYSSSKTSTIHLTCYQQYNVNFVTSSTETANFTKTITYADAYGELTTPTKTGYTFKGWFTEGGTEVKNTDTYQLTSDQTLYAHWEPNRYALNYHYNYSGAPADKTTDKFFTFDAIYSITYEPEEGIHPVGYHFDGWYYEANGETKASLKGTYKTDGATTLYAKWAPNTYGLTLYYNYENELENSVFFTKEDYFTFDAAYKITEVPSKNDYPIGYHFDGWYADKECTDGNQWTSGSSYTNPADLELYAKWTENTYTLTFELNGGSWNNVEVPNNQTTITYGKAFGSLLNDDAVQRSGYTFMGWYDSFNTQVTSSNTVSANPPSTVFAKWVINGLTVTFDANYPNNRQGAPYDNVTKDVVIGNTYTLPANKPSIAGYTFAGWKTENNIPVDESIVCETGTDHTLYGCWQANTYKVTYNPNPGNWNGSTQSVEAALTYDQAYGQDNKFPAEPTRDGYTFQGWWTAEDGGQQITDATVFETAGDQTLYAHWSSNTYKLIFDYKDEAGRFDAVGVTYDANYPAVNNYPTAPTRDGFTFVGWFDANNKEVNLSELPSRTYKTAGNQRLFAHWNPLHYTVKFKTDANSKAIDSISVAYHDVYGILPKLKENGQEVTTNWYDAPSNGMLVTPTTIFQPENVNQEFILYASTKPRKFALQLIDGNETTTIGISEGQTYADALTKAGIDKSEIGKTFLGWSATPSGTAKDLSVSFSEDCQTLYALWKNEQWKISFVDTENTKAVYGEMAVAYGDTYANGTRGNDMGLPAVATVSGKTFNGWSTSAEHANIVTNTTPVDLNVHTLYAHWTANNYTIFLHENTGVDKASAIDVTYGQAYTLSDPEARAGYTFAGWYEQNAENEFVAGATYTLASDLHLYAHWTAASNIAVSLDAQGGSDVSGITATYGQAYQNLPANATREGYTFVGWFTAAENGTEVTNATICKQAAKHTLYAHWKANNYTIYLHENNGVDKTTTLDVTYGQTYTLSALADMMGYTFDGWFTAAEGGKKYESTTYSYISNEDLDLYAHWTAVNYMVTFSVPENATLETTSKEVTFDSQYGELPTPALEGYVFSGWFNANGNIVTSTDVCRTPSNHTLTAHWKAKAYTITFDANGGECHTTNKQVVYNTAIGKLPTATLDGYTFNGWWADGATKATTEEDIFAGLENLTLTADWEACQYTVSFLPEGGITTAADKQVTYQAEYGDLPTATRDGYTFDGWFTCDNESITSDTKYTKIGDQELHAHWTAQKFMVTFCVAPEVTLDTQKEVTFDSPYGELPTPTLAGYEFTGWYSADLGGSLITSTSTVSTASNHNLYARWTEADITIHFNSNGGSEVADQTRKYEGLYCEPALPTPTKEGYTLIGWYLEDGTLVTSTTKVDRTEAHTLTAYWAQAGVPYLVLGDKWKISSPEADNDYRFKTADGKNYSLSNIRVVAERQLSIGEYQADITIFLNGVFYGVEETTVLRTTENGNFGRFTANSSKRATIQSAEMLTRWFNFDLYEESPGTWRLSISCGKQGNPTEVDNNESEQQARAKKYIEDGKVFIQTKEDRIYNASGQLVK